MNCRKSWALFPFSCLVLVSLHPNSNGHSVSPLCGLSRLWWKLLEWYFKNQPQFSFSYTDFTWNISAYFSSYISQNIKILNKFRYLNISSKFILDTWMLNMLLKFHFVIFRTHGKLVSGFKRFFLANFQNWIPFPPHISLRIEVILVQ